MPAGREDCRTLRSGDDAWFVQANVVEVPTIVVLRADFIGCEAAASSTSRVASVHVAELDETPMARAVAAFVVAEIRRRR